MSEISTSKTIVIVGASYAGLNVAHSLLKRTLPTVKDHYSLKVVLVSSTTHHYHNIASVRAIIPGQFDDDKLFQEIAPGFKQYPEGSFEFVHGTATALDLTSPTGCVTVTSTSSTQTTIAYDILVLASGSRTTTEVPWKMSPKGYGYTLAGLHKIQDEVKTAKSIIVGGAGPTGTETAAELGFEYGKTKEISLITSGLEILADCMPTNIAQGAEQQLKKLNVKVIKGTKIVSSTSATEGSTEVLLDNGEKLVVDLYLPSTGVICNTEYVPKEYLDEKGQVIVDEFLRVKGKPNIWAAGDVTNVDYAQLAYCDKQAAAVAKNLDLVIKGKEPMPYKTGGGRIVGLTLGRSKATGAFGNFKIPSLAIWWFKGRSLLTENLPKNVNGSSY